MSFIQRFQATHNLPDLMIGDLLYYPKVNRYARLIEITDTRLILNFRIDENKHDLDCDRLSTAWTEDDARLTYSYDSNIQLISRRTFGHRAKEFLINNRALDFKQ